MMLKAFGEFLDFDDEIEVEKQIKLFEDISTTDGDYSYQFTLAKTLNNTRILRNPLPDNISKPVYQRIPASILSETGAETHKGYLRIERVTEEYACSFFAGNNNWFGMITGQMSELDLSQYDVENTELNIIDSWLLDEGLVFPLLDNGGLITRSYHQLKIEDFVGGFYVKTLFERIFTEAGIKIQGELLSEWRFQRLVCLTTSNNDEFIKDRSSFVEKNQAQIIPYNAPYPGDLVTWDNDSVLPYFDGSADLFNLAGSEYLPDIKMAVDVELNLTYTSTGFAGALFLNIFVNGVSVRYKGTNAPSDTEVTGSLRVNIPMDAGDDLKVYVLQINADGDAGQILRGSIKITPTYVYKTQGIAAVPNWTKQQFISNVLRIFNVLPYFNSGDSTLTLNLFEKLKSKQPLDLSEYISETDIDYTEFISDYGQRSKLSYKKVDFDELKDYNKGRFLKYGQGIIEVDNQFLEEEKDVVTTDFANPVAYNNPVFDMSMEKTNLIQLEEGETIPFTDVANDGMGNAAFQNTAETFRIGDLVRVQNSTNPVYNGDWVVQSTPSGHVTFQGMPFDTAASGDLIKMIYKYAANDEVFLFINVPSYPRANFSNAPIVFDSGGFYPITFSSVALAYFDMINLGRQVNRDFTYSLSFGGIDDPLRYQVTMLESYFRLFARVLNDPVKLIQTAQIPYSLFHRIDFLRPITIKTLETQNAYYLNRITGYKESYLDCTFELIKI